MELEKSQPLTYNDRKFDFCETEWVIENFCLASSRDNWSFQSPEFIVRGFHATKWLMTLERNSNAGGNFIKLSLKRTEFEEGPDTIWVDWRMNISTPDRDYDSVSKLCGFKNGSKCSEDLKREKIVIEAFKHFKPDSLTVRCKLLFYSEDVCKEFQSCGNQRIRSLSEDLLHLFHSKKDCDLELRFEDKVILAHKIIACTRIGELNYLLEKEGQKIEYGRMTLDLSSLKYEGMRKVLEYVYSGDLKYVLAEPSLAISDCVWKFNISELKSYYTPNKLFFQTSVSSHEFQLKWLIPDIRKLMCHEIATSPSFIDDYFGTTWQLHASLTNEANTDYFVIRAETLGNTEPMDLCLEFAIIDKNDRYLFPIRTRGSTEGLKTSEFDKFVSGHVAKSFSDNNCLQIVGRLRLSDGFYVSSTEKQCISFVTCTPAEKCYCLLSADMGSAHECGFFSDLHLENNGIVYKIHKCILAARCSEMYDTICEMELDDDAITFPDVQPNIFCALLKYLYTGILMSSEDKEDFVKLAELSERFDLPLLKDECLKCISLIKQSHHYCQSAQDFRRESE